MKRELLLILIAAVLTLLVPLQARAVGISMPFLEKNTILISEGSSTLFTITLQNVEDTPISVKFDFTGGEVASVLDYKQAYTLPGKSMDTKIVFNLSSPLNAKINDVYDVSFSVTPLKANNGIISFAPGMGRSFKVKIIQAPDRFYLANYIKENGMMWGVILGVIVLYILYSWFKRKGKRKKR